MPSFHYPGVYVKEKNIHDSCRKLAGYLHLATTSELREFISSDTTSSIINPFLAAVDGCFGHTGRDLRSLKMVRVDRVMQCYNEPGMRDHLSTFQNVSEICAVPGRDTGLAVYVFTINALINAFPTRFCDPSRAEDVHRCMYLLKYILKSRGACRQVKRGNNNLPAIIPKYRAVDDEGSNPATQVNENAAKATPNDQDTHPPTEVEESDAAKSASEEAISPVQEGEGNEDEQVDSVTQVEEDTTE